MSKPDAAPEPAEPHVTLTALNAQADELKLAVQGWEGQRAQANAALREAEAKILSHNGALEIVGRLIAAAQAGQSVREDSAA